MPLVVLTRSKDKFGDVRLEEERNRAQAELARLSRRGRQVYVDSGHNIQLEKPSVIVECVREMVEGIRKRRGGR